MNRLQKKCIIASAGIHLLLAVMLFLGPAFLSPRSPDTTPVMEFVAISTTDDNPSGGGDNTVKAPPALAVDPQPAPAPVVPPAPVLEKPQPAPVVDTPPPTPVPRVAPKEMALPKNDFALVESKKPVHKIVVNTQPVIGSTADEKAAREAQAKVAADAKRRADRALNRALAGIRGGVAGSTEIRLAGPGGGGVPYGNFLSAVKKAYWDAWTVPDGVPNATAKVSVTIARDGTVVSARIIDGSGNAAVDDSVQRALDRVKFAAPLPEGAKEDQRTVTINFNTEAKLTG